MHQSAKGRVKELPSKDLPTEDLQYWHLERNTGLRPLFILTCLDMEMGFRLVRKKRSTDDSQELGTFVSSFIL